MFAGDTFGASSGPEVSVCGGNDKLRATLFRTSPFSICILATIHEKSHQVGLM